MSRAWIVLAAAVTLSGCVSMEPQTAADSSDSTEAVAAPIRDPRAAAYYYYSIAR